jgi:Leucine-rich repeat (LRR) protein
LILNQFLQIPGEIGLLSGLETLSFNDNFVSGTLPKEVFALPGLKMANFASNRFYGSLPSELRDAISLEVLELNGNQLDGAIVSEIGQATKLTELNLANNTFESEVPTELFRLTNLVSLNLEGNMGIVGRIPTEFGLFADLRQLSISSTNIRARIPTDFGFLKSLEDLRIANTEVGGDIPAVLGLLTQLTHLDLSGSNFRQSLPEAIGDLSELGKFFLRRFDTTLLCDTPYLNLSALRFLHLTAYLALNDNDLQGPILPHIGNLTKLHTLLLNGNRFSGEIPTQLSGLTGLGECRCNIESPCRRQHILTGTSRNLPSNIGFGRQYADRPNTSGCLRTSRF